MVDDNGANYCTMKQAFGVNFVTPKVVSRQMHYKNDVNRVSYRIGSSYRDLFKSICYGRCCIATGEEYNEQKQQLDEIANMFPDISQLVTWWDARKYHMFSAFKCFGYSNVTLAKSGNAVLMHHPIMVVRGCMRWHIYNADTNSWILFIYSQGIFFQQQRSLPPSLWQGNRSTQICTVKAYTAEFSNRHTWWEAIQDNTNPQVFVLASGVRHRPLKTKTGIEGTFLHKKKLK